MKKTKVPLSALYFLFICVFFIVFAICYSAKANDSVKNSVCDVEKVLIEKSKNTMKLLDCHGDVVKSYTVRVGYNQGPKQCDGDKKTPEGTYKIKDKRNSKYVRFLEIDYPRQKDIINAKKIGCKPGDAIGIHYFNKELYDKNTQYSKSNGCITVWNKDEIKEIDKLVKVGTVVEIVQ